MTRMTTSAVVTALVILTSIASAQSSRSRTVPKAEKEPPPQNLSWQPTELVNGSPCLFRYIPAEPLKSLTGNWMGHAVSFRKEESSTAWIGFAGVDYDAPPGIHLLALSGMGESGARLSFSTEINVKKGSYRTTAITVPARYIEPDPKDLPRIKEEKELKSEVFSKVSPEQFWSGAFLAPVFSSTSAEYGSQRTYNGTRQSIHQGLDFAAAKGTSVTAVNAGRVVLAREMYFEGGFVVVDHGQGLLSLYLHLSEIRVKAGDRVGKGQQLGLSGATGRVTGPHLHLAIRWQGLYLDPQKVLRMRFAEGSETR